MLSKLFSSLYNKVFVNIVIQKSQTLVYVQEDSKSGMVRNNYEEFSTTTINNKMHNFIESYTNETPFSYISVLDNSKSQGAVPNCNKRDILPFFDESTSKYICYNHSWTFYTSKYDLNSLQKHYERVGVDFIFSPFLILSNFFKDKIKTTFALFILIEETHITIGVFDNTKLLYADHITMHNAFDGNNLLIDEDEDEDDFELDLDTIDLDTLDDEELDNFSQIEDLDGMEEIDEFAESIEDKTPVNIDEDKPSDNNELNDDYDRFTIIQKSINNFYKDTKYDSKFIEQTYVADAIGVSVELKGYLEEEMFLTTFIRKIDLNHEVYVLAKAEI